MRKRGNAGYLIVSILVFAVLFRGQLWAMTPWATEVFSPLAVLIALVGSVVCLGHSYAIVTIGQLRKAEEVAIAVILTCVAIQYFGGRLEGFAGIDLFWAHVVIGATQTATLYGALYGARELWTGAESKS